MTNDTFNRPPASLNFGSPFQAVAWDDTTTDGVIYLRGDYADVCVIKRIDTTAGTVTWAFGAWSDRATLEYGDDRKINR